MRTCSPSPNRIWQRAVAGLAVAAAAVLTTAGCAEEALEDQEITEVDDTDAPVDPTVEPVD